MPSIAGFFDTGSIGSPEALLETMMETLHMEDHFSSGWFHDGERGIHICWTAHEHSFADGAPWENERKDKLLIFSGEDFQDRETFEELREKGHSFRADSAEYIVHMYEEYGQGLFERLNGWFTGLLVDRSTGKACLFVDRFGMKKLFYCIVDGNLIFSNEIKPILAASQLPKEVDPDALADYLTFGCLLGEKTWFRGIQATSGGALLTWSKKAGLSESGYFTETQWEGQERVTLPEYRRTLSDLLKRNLTKYFQGRQQNGFSLTGGFDTRMILANCRPVAGELPCYTFDGKGTDTNDTKVARKVAASVGQSHETFRLDDTFFGNFGDLVEDTIRISCGHHDASGAHDLYFNRMARQTATVRISGKFGSEIIRGFSMFKPFHLRGEAVQGDLKPFIGAALSRYEENIRVHPTTASAFKNIPWKEYGKLLVEQSQVTFRTPYMDNDLVAFTYKSPAEPFDNRVLCEELVRLGSEELFRIRTDRGYCGGGNRYLSRLIQKYHYLTFMAEWYVNEGMPDALAVWDKKLQFTGLDRMILGRHKFLFYRKWYRDELSGYVKEILLDTKAKERSYVNPQGLEKMVASHLSGRANFTETINRLVSLEIFHRVFVDS